MFGVPGCFTKCNMLQRWGNLQLYMRQREPQFHHEIKPIAVDFQMFHLQELPRCEISPLRNIMRHTWHPWAEKRHAKLVAAREHLAGLKCALILFSNCNTVARLLFLLLWNPLLVHCSDATKPAQFFQCLDFGSPRVFVDCPVPLSDLRWSSHKYKLSWKNRNWLEIYLYWVVILLTGRTKFDAYETSKSVEIVRSYCKAINTNW